MYAIRSLTRVDELKWVMDLQRLVYGDDDHRQMALYTLIDFTRNGGHIIGAFDGNLLVGFLVAFFGTNSRDSRRPAMANLKLVISRVGVHPDYRNSGAATQMIGRFIEIADQQGVRLATYTFNPLGSREAYLLIRKLGAIGKVFTPGYYGDEDGLVAELWLTQNRVRQRLMGEQRSHLSLDHYLEANTPILNIPEVEPDTRKILPYPHDIAVADSTMLLLEIPAEVEMMADLEAWQRHIRTILLTVLQHGYVVTDFLHENYEGRPRAFYVLSFDGPRFVVDL
ncbi:MAG: GNAT family N-acetyltransferase [Anaerolineales bacterium]|nr:GNAT family N-acetyltransferase [Anaerolineales bacterium]